MRLSTHHMQGLGKKYVDNERLWLKTEEMVRRAMDNGGVPYVERADEAAFYGPKIDVQIWSAIGKEFTLATNQVDFAQPGRFNLAFINKEGQEETPLCIHRAPLSTHERMIGFLIEHYAGAFPAWLSPEQVRVIPSPTCITSTPCARRPDGGRPAAGLTLPTGEPRSGRRSSSKCPTWPWSATARWRRSRSRCASGMVLARMACQ
jgi:hypothetical protein